MTDNIRKLDELKINTIQKLRREGYSVKEIKWKIQNISVSSISKYIQGIELSPPQRRRLKEKEVHNWQKFVERKTVQIKDQQEEISLEKTRIIAHLLFDGWINTSKTSHNKYIFSFVCSSPIVIQQFIDDVKAVYGLENYWTEERNGEMCSITSFNSIQVIQDLMKYATTYKCGNNSPIQVPIAIKEADENIKREFLRCFWSDEGGLSFDRSRRRLQFILVGTQTNLIFLREIARLHDDFGIVYRISEKKYQIAIGRKAEKRKFVDRIGFLDGSLVTRGHFIGREKNDLLREMLENHTLKSV